MPAWLVVALVALILLFLITGGMMMLYTARTGQPPIDLQQRRDEPQDKP